MTTMQRPTFNHRRAEATWTDEEISEWLCYTKANPHQVPWRLQWLEYAEQMLVARATARTGA
jgi:hypothetical protein